MSAVRSSLELINAAEAQNLLAAEVLRLNDRLLAVIAEQAQALESVEWASINAFGEECCPRCQQSRERGHQPTCALFRLSDPAQVDRRLEEAVRGA